jgi:hypothetical protein
MERSGKYRARHTMSQSEKSYIKTTPWPLAAFGFFTQTPERRRSSTDLYWAA